MLSPHLCPQVAPSGEASLAFLRRPRPEGMQLGTATQAEEAAFSSTLGQKHQDVSKLGAPALS